MRCYHNGRRLASGLARPKGSCAREGGDADMMMDLITLAGFILAVFVAGIAVGQFKEKVERLDRRLDDEEHKSKNRNDRPALDKN